MGLTITVVTVLLTIRDGILDPRYREHSVVPPWKWYWWTIIGLSAMLTLILESTYRTYAQALGNYRKVTKRGSGN